MPNINVRGLSDKTKEDLRIKAAKAGFSSLEAYARHVLQTAATANGREPEHIVDLAEKYFGTEGIEVVLPDRSSMRKKYASC